MLRALRDGVLRSPVLYVLTQTMLGAHRLRVLAIKHFLCPAENEKILDVGCGPGHILQFLPKLNYVGFDTDAGYIEYARQRYGDRGKFVCEQFEHHHLNQLGPFDGVMLFGVLHHLSDERASDLLKLLASGLRHPNGKAVTIDPCFTPDQSAVQRFVAKSDRGKFVRSESGYRRLVDQHFRDVRTQIFHNVCRIPSTELVMRLSVPTKET